VACLIAAINAANANGEDNTIRLAAGTYTLTSVNNTTDGANGLPSITSTLTIIGVGAETTIIARAASAPPFRLVHVAAAGHLVLEGLTLQGGSLSGLDSGGSGAGGGLYNAGGTLTLTHSTITDNFARRGYGGGGLVNVGGTVTLTQTTIARNATSQAVGGGLYNVGGTVILTNSTIADNSPGSTGSGGGLYNAKGTIILAHSTITRNLGGGEGGGLYNREGIVTLTHSTIAGNRISGSGGGGGLYNHEGEVTLTQTTISDNSCGGEGGGLVNVGGTVTLTQTTIARNSGIDGGGGLANFGGTVILTNSTIADNSAGFFGGGGLYNDGGFVTLQNMILARNTATTSPDCAGPITSLGHNLLGAPTGCTITLQPTDLIGDPKLGTFTDLGQPGTGHVPLLPGSPAIDAGNDAACPPTDQLGKLRVGQCDIGAIEFQPTNRCPHDQGFWRNNTGAWPVASLTLGRQAYTQAELLALLDTPPRGDASVILAHQLITAKLNIANGSNSAPISSTIADADNLLSQFGMSRLPYSIRTSSAIGQQMVNDANVLDRYNNGDLTPDCTP
jgi:hypothetical protein